MLLTVAFLIGLVPLKEATAGNITMSGTVRDRHRGTAVSSALVRIVDPSGAQLGSATTNGLGQWQISVPITGVEDHGEVPRTFRLEQNYPNPFNPSTKLPFFLEAPGRVRIAVHDILGRLVDAKEFDLRPGSYTVDWKAKGSAGVLFYSIETNDVRLTRKMIQLDGGGGGGLGSALPTAFAANARLATPALVDSCQVITSSMIYEPDTSVVALKDTAGLQILVETVHDRAVVFDLHNDVMEVVSGSNFTYQLADRHSTNHTDIPRLRDGGVDAQVFSIWISETTYPKGTHFATAMKFLDSLKSQARRNADNLVLTTTADSVRILQGAGKIAGIVVVEGGHCIEDKIENLLTFYNAGVRIMTLTWNNSTSWAVSAKDAANGKTGGLNDLGKQIVRTMDSLGMIIDVSHVGPQTVTDILATSKNPIIASHSGAYALRGHYRNLTDAQIRAIAQRGGVIGVVFYPPFLVASGTATLNNVLQHIDYIKNLVGVDCIALGSDFDGIEVWPVGLENVTKFPDITTALLQRGYSREDVRKILGENFLRVFRAVCK